MCPPIVGLLCGLVESWVTPGRSTSPCVLDGCTKFHNSNNQIEKFVSVASLSDQKVAHEAPPPPTFTVPAFRARKHRGGESKLLKDAYPSGFGNPSENRPRPSAIDSSTRRALALTGGPRLRGLLHESKEVGVPPWGATAGRRTLNITRVIVGAKDVVDSVGNELVQFGPGFSIGPAEHSSPRPHQSRPRTPATPLSPARMTIDGSSLKAWSSLLVGATTVDRDCENEWSPRKNRCGHRDGSSPRHDDKREGFKRIRPTTADTDQCSRGPEPWPYTAESLTGRSGRSSRPSTAGLGPKPAFRKRRGPGIAAASALGVHEVGGNEQADGRKNGVKKDPAAVSGVVGLSTDDSLGRGRCPRPGDGSSDHGDAVRNPPKASKPSQPLLPLKARGTSKPDGGQGEEDKGEKPRGQVVLLNKDEVTGSGSIGGELAMDAQDNPSVWSDGSACFAASVIMNENSGAYSPLVADSSAEQVSAKRSFSTLDTERYRGSLSKDATDILRSHLESRSKAPSNANSCFSDSRTAPTDATALVSPAPPPTPTPPGQVRLTEERECTDQKGINEGVQSPSRSPS